MHRKFVDLIDKDKPETQSLHDKTTLLFYRNTPKKTNRNELYILYQVLYACKNEWQTKYEIYLRAGYPRGEKFNTLLKNCVVWGLIQEKMVECTSKHCIYDDHNGLHKKYRTNVKGLCWGQTFKILFKLLDDKNRDMADYREVLDLLTKLENAKLLFSS